MKEVTLNGIKYIREDVVNEKIKENGFFITDELDKLFRPFAFLLYAKKYHTTPIEKFIEKIEKLKNVLQLIKRVQKDNYYNDLNSSFKAGEHWNLKFPYIETQEIRAVKLSVQDQELNNALLSIKKRLKQAFEELKRLNLTLSQEELVYSEYQFFRYLFDSVNSYEYSQLTERKFITPEAEELKEKFLQIDNELKQYLISQYDILFQMFKTQINTFYDTYCIGTYEGKTRKEWLMSV